MIKQEKDQKETASMGKFEGEKRLLGKPKTKEMFNNYPEVFLCSPNHLEIYSVDRRETDKLFKSSYFGVPLSLCFHKLNLTHSDKHPGISPFF